MVTAAYDVIERLSDFLIEPQESLEVEIKRWLNLSDSEHKANLAKAILAIANHGGGIIIIGFEEKESVYVPSEPRPLDLNLYNQDYINGIIAHYAEPEFHCEVRIVKHPTSGVLYPVIRIPGGSVPIRTKRGGPENGKTISNNTYYIRRPGPASEPPKSAQEWDSFLGRCVTSKKESMLDSIRTILTGNEFSKQKTQAFTPPLEEWEKSCLSQWKSLVTSLPEDHPAQFKYGRYYCSYLINELNTTITANELLGILRQIRGYTGWSPFYVFSRQGLEPYLMDDALQCWLGKNTEDSSHADFWRASPAGKLFLMRGYAEDCERITNELPGKFFDLTIPIWRVAECLLHALHFAETIDKNESELTFCFTWEGIDGRVLKPWANPRRMLDDKRISHQKNIKKTINVSTTQIRNNLHEIVYSLVFPLYELFSLSQVPKKLIEEEVSNLLGNR